MPVNGRLLLEQGRQPWKATLGALYRDLQRYDIERSLLRAIDGVIIEDQSESSEPIEAAFTEGAKIVSDIYRLPEPGRCYVYTGKALVVLDEDRPGACPLRLPLSDSVQALAETLEDDAVVLSQETSDALFDACGDFETILIQPVRPKGQPLLAVLIFVDTAPPAASVLDEPELRNTVAGIARQLCIAFGHWSRANGDKETQELWDIMMSERLGAKDSFKLLAKRVPRFLPTFGPLKIPDPEAQILMLVDSDSVAEPYLTIRGSTGNEDRENTKIDVGRSITGLLFERPTAELPYFCDDPRKPRWASKYKSYLGQDKVIRTEFALRLIGRGTDDDATPTRTSGVLNLESEMEDAFNVHHVFAMQLLAARLAPMAEVFESRIRNNTVMHVSVMSTTSKFLDGLARVFDHAVRSPLVALRLDAQALETIAKQEAEVVAAASPSAAARAHELSGLMAKAAEGVEKSRRHLSQFIDDFKEDISGFSELGGFGLRDLLAETADVARRSVLEPDDDIRIEVSGARSAEVYCSRLLKQHVYSLLTNAVYSVKERLEEDPSRPGVITLKIARPSAPTKSQERELNRRWLVTIRDNGAGVSPEDLERLRAFEPGTHLRRSEPGQGYGLTAVHRYVESINGVMNLDSQQGEFFEVRLLLDEFNVKIHESASTRVR